MKKTVKKEKISTYDFNTADIKLAMMDFLYKEYNEVALLKPEDKGCKVLVKEDTISLILVEKIEG